MPTCPKCGSRVREGMNFCPNCGSALKIEPTPPSPPAGETPSAQAPSPPQPAYRAEKAEKQEKQEKGERGEKQEKAQREERYEKRESNFIGLIVGGIVLIFLGLLLYWTVTGSLRAEVFGAAFLVIIGVIIIVGAIYAILMAVRRHPQT